MAQQTRPKLVDKHEIAKNMVGIKIEFTQRYGSKKEGLAQGTIATVGNYNLISMTHKLEIKEGDQSRTLPGEYNLMKDHKSWKQLDEA